MINIDYISKEIADAVCGIYDSHPDAVFCGSFGLVLQGLLERKVHDIDILVDKNYYGDGGFYNDIRREVGFTSHSFMLGKDETTCFKLDFPGGIHVDVLHNANNKPDFTHIEFFGRMIKVETIDGAIDAKKQYVVNDRSQFSTLKHFRDLILLNVPRKELAEILKISWINNPDPIAHAIATVCDSGAIKTTQVSNKFDDMILEDDDLPF